MTTHLERPSRRSRWLKNAFVGLVLLTMALLGAGVYFTERYSVMTGSMEPTLEVGKTVWALRVSEAPNRGAIVSFENPTRAGSGEVLIKRVVGLPGERVEAIDGVVHVDFEALDESGWLPSATATSDFGPIDLGPNHYFLLGDNRQHSIDSRTFGSIATDQIVYEIRQ